MSQPSAWRAPSLRLLANGNPIVGAVRVETVSNNHYAADTISGDVALGADPNFGAAWWDAQTDITLEAQIALPTTLGAASAWTSIIVATVDHLQYDLNANRVRFDGRDLTARFIDTKTQAAYPNKTSSQIATLLAQEHGMQVSATPTPTLVGVYYNLEHDRLTSDNLSHQTTEWDLLTYLAQEEDYDVWVQGNTLYFQPPTASTAPNFNVVYTQGTLGAQAATLNVQTVNFERSLTLAKDIQVTVKSTSLRDGRAYTRVVKATGAKSPGAAKSQTQNYVYTKPGLTPDQALKMANQKLAELSKHERILNIQMPGEVLLTPRSMINFYGSGTGFDQVYFIDEITRSIDFSDGFTQNIRCKNTSPKTQTTVL